MLKWSENEIELRCGDATDPKMYEEIPQVNAVIFDPPFVALKQGFRQIRKENKTQLDEIELPLDFPTFFHNICKNTVSFIDKTGWFMYKCDIHTYLIFHPIALKYFDFIGDTIWDKRRIGTGYYIRKQHEYIMLYRPKKAINSYTLQRPMKKGLKSTAHGNSKGRAFRSIQSVLNSNGGEFGQKNRKHINQTECELWKKYIEFFVPKKGIVLDPTMGCGSLPKACKILNRKCFGIELKKEFYEKAIDEVKSIGRSEKITEFLEVKTNA